MEAHKTVGQLAMNDLEKLLQKSAEFHRHLCPRQVLGVRMGLFAGEILGLAVPQADNVKRIFTIVEMDGCGADGVSVATNCWIGRRTLRLEDFGKVAATFADTQTGQAVRIFPQQDVRRKAHDYAPEAKNKWEAMLLGYQRMPASELLVAQPIVLRTSLNDLVSRPGVKTKCEICGEEIMNEREIIRARQILCRSCAGFSYYDLSADEEAIQFFTRRNWKNPQRSMEKLENMTNVMENMEQ